YCLFKSVFFALEWPLTIKCDPIAVKCAAENFCRQMAIARARHVSRTTSVGFLSSRKPRKTGARNLPSRVHSANLISATNFGFTQCILRIMAGEMPCTHWPFCLEGKSTNGQVSLCSLRNFLYNVASDFAVKPVPTFPANTSLLSL